MSIRIRYLVASLALSALVFIITILLFPEWRQNLRVILALAVMVISGVVGFIASARQAFASNGSQEGGSDSKPQTRIINLSSGTYIEGDINVKGDFVSGDKYEINPPK